MSTSFSSTLNTAPKQTTAATAAAVAASNSGGSKGFICSGKTPNAQIATSKVPKDRILKMCRLLENKKRRALSNEEAQALTERIESILYKSSANGADALDRVKSILAERRQHRRDQQQKQQHPKENQMSPLQEMLGTKRLAEIEQLVSEINTIRSGTSWAGIIRASLSLSTSAGTSTSLARKMPREVDAIYFRTRLVSAYTNIKNQAQRVDTYNWSELIDEAKTNIAAYHALEDTHKSIIAETPVVCMGGLCSRVASSPRAA